MMDDMRLVVTGAAGRMGQTLVRAIANTPGTVLASALERPGHSAVGSDAGVIAGMAPLGLRITDDVDAAFGTADGVIDFSTPSASVRFADLAAEHHLVHVIGTTGFSSGDDDAIHAAARRTTLVRSPNMSVMLNVLAVLVEQVSGLLDNDVDIEILDVHHRNKVDAPSGTSLMLAGAAAKGRNVNVDDVLVTDRGGPAHHGQPRKPGEIGLASIRQGSVICDHTVSFGSMLERIELRHIADDRSLFAAGAIRAARWGRNRPAGLYSMSDVLDLGRVRRN